MRKRYSVWLWIAVVLLLFTGAVHSLSLFMTPAPQNETEKQLLLLLTTYKQDAGAGFHPTLGDLLTALSSCFTFLCLLAGASTAYLLRKKVAPDILKGLVLIQLLVMSACFVVMLIFTFLPPIVLTGLCVLFLAIGLLTIQSPAQVGAGPDVPLASQN